MVKGFSDIGRIVPLYVCSFGSSTMLPIFHLEDLYCGEVTERRLFLACEMKKPVVRQWARSVKTQSSKLIAEPYLLQPFSNLGAKSQRIAETSHLQTL